MENSFKNLIPSGSEPRVLVENGEFVCARCGDEQRAERPRYVIMPWREFEAMRRGVAQSVRFAEVADEALDVPVFASARRKFSELAVDTAKIRLEDLPV